MSQKSRDTRGTGNQGYQNRGAIQDIGLASRKAVRNGSHVIQKS